MAISTGVAAIGAAGSIAKFFEGADMQRNAQKYINDFKWQDLSNPYQNLQVSTLGSDLQKEQSNLAASQDVNALQQGGTRALVGGLGRVEAQRNLTNRTIASNLDEQQKAIDRMKAQQDVANQQMIENRQANELQGYGQMMNVGLGMKYQGINDLANVAGAGATSLQSMNEGEGFGGFTPQVQSIAPTTPQGLNPLFNSAPTPLRPQYVDQSTLPDWAKIKY